MYLVAAGRNWETWSWSCAGGEATGHCCWVQPPRNSLVCQFASMAVCMVLWKSGKSELSISSIFLCIHLSICLFACLPIYSPDISYLSIDPSIYQSISLSINLPIYLSTYLSMYLSNLILFDPIWSYSILSDLILSNPIQVYLIPSNPIWSHLFPSDPIWSHLILSIPIYSYLAINQPTWYIQWMYLFVCRSV